MVPDRLSYPLNAVADVSEKTAQLSPQTPRWGAPDQLVDPEPQHFAGRRIRLDIPKSPSAPLLDDDRFEFSAPREVSEMEKSIS